MRRIVEFIRHALAFALLALIVWGAYQLLSAIVSSLTSIQSDLAVAIIAASATILVSVLSLVISKNLENRAVVVQDLRVKKIPIYEELVAIVFRMVYADKLGEQKPSDTQLVKWLATATEKMIVWGSDEVVSAFRKFRAASLQADAKPAEALFAWEDIMLAIRKDLGHKNTRFKRGTLLGLFVNDIDKYV